MNKSKLQNILFSEKLTKDEIVYLLNLTDLGDISLLHARADQIRKDFFGDEVHFRGVIEISNYCSQNCNYCGLREDNYTLKRFRMEPDEILETASKIAKLGIGTVVLKSGEDQELDTDIIAYLIYSIKSSSNVAITLSLGERGFDEYKSWRIAGADRYILRHETCDKEKYSQYRNKKILSDRIQHLKYLKRLGYQIGTGNLIGLPLQSIKDIADDIILMKELDVDIGSFSPFIPSPFTPYRNMKSGSTELTLKTIAVARLVLRNAHIPSTMALDTIDECGREKGLTCGANVVLPDFTPLSYRRDYSVYPNRRDGMDDPLISHKNLQNRIEKIGREISFSRGDSLKNAASISF